MQIDFHHAVTYAVARLAGFSHPEANIIGYSAQYVDDATNDGLITFDNGGMYKRTSSAHKMLDYRNSQALANSLSWLPFHFLPGNGGLPAGKSPEGQFIEKLICRPNSYVAKDMIRAAIANRHAAYGLHRLGITAHVFVDTWAHQGFVGRNHRVNEASDIIGEDGKPDKKLIDRMMNYFISEGFPLGHGAVLSNPDRPYLIWGYTNGRGEVIRRNNPRDFIEAADELCKAFQRYRAGNAEAAVAGLPKQDRDRIEHLLTSLKEPDEEKRHHTWLQAIGEGHFSFGASKVEYVPKGAGSWKAAALNTVKDKDDDDEVFTYREGFLTSDWKRFHDAIQAHRFTMLQEILPRYGMCAA